MMTLVGQILIVTGGIGLTVSLLTDTTVRVPGETLERVSNLGLIAQQLVWVVASGSVLVSGVLFACFGMVRDDAKTWMKCILSKMDKRTEDGNTSAPAAPAAPCAVSETPECNEGVLDRVLNGECLPPKFDERGRPLR